MGPVLYCMFGNNLSETLKFRYLFIFPDDLKIPGIAKTKKKIKINLKPLSNWIDTSRVNLVLDIFYKL